MEASGSYAVCDECNQQGVISTQEIQARNACQTLGFKFRGYTKGPDGHGTVEYTCVCGNKTSCQAAGLYKKDRQAICPQCQNEKFKLKLVDLKRIFEECGCELLETEYPGHKDIPLLYRCECGRKDTKRKHDILRGRRCPDCKVAKYRATCMRLWGVENASQHPEVFHKINASMYRKKRYTSPSGKDYIVQGYEPLCLRELITEVGIPEDVVIAGEEGIPTIRYKLNGKSRTWYPDVWISDAERLIEVKSTFTYNFNPQMMKAKMEASPYPSELWIYNDRNVIYDRIYYEPETKEFTSEYGNVKIGELINGKGRKLPDTDPRVAKKQK
jgi:hypothetical protein